MMKKSAWIAEEILPRIIKRRSGWTEEELVEEILGTISKRKTDENIAIAREAINYATKRTLNLNLSRQSR